MKDWLTIICAGGFLLLRFGAPALLIVLAIIWLWQQVF